MTKKNSKAFKKLIREHMDRTDMPYEAAMRDLQRRRSEPRQDRTLEQLLAALGISDPSIIVLSDAPGGGSADVNLARQHSLEVARLGLRQAKTGRTRIVVWQAEEECLLQAGAADGAIVQVVRSFRTDRGTTFSEQCPACSRWIFCGTEKHDAVCHCGQRYRVAFDGLEDWGLKSGQLCMDCGEPFRLSKVDSGFNSWRPVNDWQVQCHRCREAGVQILRACKRWGADGPTTGFRNPSPSIVALCEQLWIEGLITRGWTLEENLRTLGVRLTPAGVEYLRRHPESLDDA